jgi:hypothetical protein
MTALQAVWIGQLANERKSNDLRLVIGLFAENSLQKKNEIWRMRFAQLAAVCL